MAAPVNDDPSREDALSDAESDASSDSPVGDYLPISAADHNSDGDDAEAALNCGVPTFVHSNGHVITADLNPSAWLGATSLFDLQNGGSSMDDDDVVKEEEEEEEREMEAEIERAFLEDERRRSARLTSENAARVMEAMRGISFAGAPPAWADRAGEDWWASQLRQLRERRVED